MIYVYIIVGGGISGIYASLLLDKLNKGTILVIEKSDKLGGRIETISTDNDLIEMGAGRIISLHLNLINLLKYINLYDKLSKSSKAIKYYINNDINKKSKTDETSDFYKIINELIILSNKNSKIVKSYTFYKFIQMYMGTKNAEIIKNKFGYDDDILYRNAYDSIKMFREEFNEHATYHRLDGGMKQIIDNIVIKLSKNVKIELDSECVEINKCDDLYKCTYKTHNIMTETYCKNIILAIPVLNLQKINIFKNISDNLSNKITNKPLMRVYMYFPPVHIKNKKIINNVWFSDLQGSYVSNSIVRQIIPINKKTGLIMISYSDGYTANNLNSLDNANILESEILKCIRMIFNDRKIPEPIKTYKKYWHTGTHLWLKYMNEKEILQLMKPIKNENIYCVSEAISPLHNWVEGSLISVNLFIEHYARGCILN